MCSLVSNAFKISLVSVPIASRDIKRLCLIAGADRGDINVYYPVRGGPSNFAWFVGKNVGSRKFCGQNFFKG